MAKKAKKVKTAKGAELRIVNPDAALELVADVAQRLERHLERRPRVDLRLGIPAIVAVAAVLLGILPVSYTHLDVYKRQVIPSDVEVAQAGKSLLANGSALYTLASDDFEVLRITFVFRAGSAMQRVPFSASAAANMLAEGTRDMTAHQIAERLDYYGSYYDVNIDRDYAYISFCTLSKFFDETLAVAKQILLHPVFPEEELRTYCAKRKQRLAVERTKVDTQAREAFARALFGPSHPYGISSRFSLNENIANTNQLTQA